MVEQSLSSCGMNMSITPDSLKQAVERFRVARRPVVFPGAGVSAESGIPTFRVDDGFWQQWAPSAQLGGKMPEGADSYQL